MKKTTAYYQNLTGTNYQIGVQLAEWIQKRPGALDILLSPSETFPKEKLIAIQSLFDQYCPGINDEIKGFADHLGIQPGQVLHYAMSYLECGCSLMASLPQKNEEGHTLLACTYDFNDELDDLCLTTTKVNGKYTHTSTLCNTFGRTNGMNEFGLSICQSSNGVPVGNFEGGSKAGVTGLMFWSVIRSLLENCKDIGEVAILLKKMPIAFNLNLLMADATGKITLFQCLNGYKAFRQLTSGQEEGYLCVTNHAILPEIAAQEKIQIDNSVRRYQLIRETFDYHTKISKDIIRNLITTSYPDGLCCHYYQGFFGLLHAVLFDVEDQSVEIVFGSPQKNPWRIFLNKSYSENREFEVSLPYVDAPASFYSVTKK